jgi:hypothetical protein
LSLSKELDILVEDGYKIADMRNIVGLKKKVYHSSEPGFNEEDNNFGHMVVQEIHAHQYDEWFNEVEKVFERFGLQKSKFRIYSDTFNPETESNLSAQRFLKRLSALEKMTKNEGFRKSFVSTASLPPLVFSRNTLSQGDGSHELKNEYSLLFKLLWKDRAIFNSLGETIKEPIPLTRSMTEEKTKINHDALERISKGINSIRQNKHIQVRLKYPEPIGVYLEVTQDIE